MKPEYVSMVRWVATRGVPQSVLRLLRHGGVTTLDFLVAQPKI